MLEKCNKDCMVILNNSKGESVKTAEEREYSCAADGEEGFIEAILNGNESVSRLQARKTINTQNEMQLTVCQPHPNPLQIFQGCHTGEFSNKVSVFTQP